MEISSTLPLPKSGTDIVADNTSAISSDFETFLKMLTVQLENQDPLKPIESSDYAVQLATFSGVEQQVKTNDLLAALSSGFGLSGIAQYAGWVGMEARVAAPVAFTGQPVTLVPNPAPGADTANLVAFDQSGTQVTRQSIPIHTGSIDWAGVASDGSPLPNGTYRFELESLAKGQVISTETVESYTRVTEVKSGPGSTILVLAGGGEVTPDQVSGLRE